MFSRESTRILSPSASYHFPLDSRLVNIDIDALDRLRAFVATHGNQGDAAKALGVSRQYVQQMLTRKIPVSERILNQLGLRRTIVEDEPEERAS